MKVEERHSSFCVENPPGGGLQAGLQLNQKLSSCKNDWAVSVNWGILLEGVLMNKPYYSGSILGPLILETPIGPRDLQNTPIVVREL